MRVACALVITCAERLVMVTESTLARSLAPEDIKSGTYVMTLHRQYQLMMGKCSAVGDPEVVIVDVVVRPFCAQLPAKVVGVCLPYVVVKRETGKTEMLDTRSERLARVPKRFAKTALKSHLPKKGKKKSKKKGKKKK